MLVIASCGHIDENIKLSFDSTCAVPKDSFYMEFKHSKIDYEDKSVPCYVILPHELVSIINGASVILITGYKLEQLSSNHAQYLLFKAVQDNLGSKTLSVIANNEILLDFEHEHTLEIDVADDWKFVWPKGQPARFKHDTRQLVCGEQISAEYEGTPAQCYRFTLPYLNFVHAPQCCVRYSE